MRIRPGTIAFFIFSPFQAALHEQAEIAYLFAKAGRYEREIDKIMMATDSMTTL
jgi:hypothetical protein